MKHYTGQVSGNISFGGLSADQWGLHLLAITFLALGLWAVYQKRFRNAGLA